MKQIENYISNQDSDYAVFINGLWGKGKTYYIDNVLKEWLTKQTPQRELFYFSANGIKNTNELHDIIITETAKRYFETKSEGFRKRVTDVVGDWSLFKKVKDNEKKFIKILNLVNSVNKAKNIFRFADMFTPNQVVIVIDDLERISPNYNYEEFFGYINNQFIEHGNYKLILIGDQSKDSIKKSEFDKIKEKYIRWSFDFQNDLTQILPALFERYKINTKYFKHLTEYLDFIHSLLTGFEIENLRTVKYFLEVYENIYSCTTVENEYILNDLIYFTLITSFEARQGTFKIFKSHKELPDIIYPKEEIQRTLIYNPANDRTEEAPKYKTKFHEKEQEAIDAYQKYSFNRLVMFTENNVKYQFFKSIYEYISAGILDQNNLKNEIEEYCKIKKPIIKYERKTNKHLDAISSFRTLTEKELDTAILSLKEDVKLGKLDIGEFIRAGNFLNFLAEEELFSDSVDAVNNFLKENINKVEINGNLSGLHHHFDFEMSRIEKNNKEFAEELKSKIDESYKIRISEKAVNQFNDWDPKGEDAYSEFQSIIENISSDEIVQKIIESIKDRNFIDGVTKQIHEHYRSINAGEHYSKHLDKLSEVKNQLEEKESKTTDRIDKWYINKMTKNLNKSIEHIKNTA